MRDVSDQLGSNCGIGPWVNVHCIKELLKFVRQIKGTERNSQQFHIRGTYLLSDHDSVTIPFVHVEAHASSSVLAGDL